MRQYAFAGCLLFLSAFFSLAALPVAAAEPPPNIVVFLVDDLGATDLGCFGSQFYETPHLDRLAAAGIRFTAAYSACPVCSPTRACLMTGRYPQRCGITDFIAPTGANQPGNWARNTRLLPASNKDELPLEERTIAEVLRDAGYATFFAGKWHLGGKGYLPTDQGFEINKGGNNSGGPRSYFSPYNNPNLPDGPPGEQLPLRLADETCAFIGAHKDRPFFTYLSFYSVHIPLQSTPELIKKYEEKAKRLGTLEPSFAPEHESKVRLNQGNPIYAGMMESMDAAVGRVLGKLDELGLAQDTLVYFTADNGGVATKEGWPTSNRPLRAGKGWLYEGGIRVPTIARWPKVIQPGSESNTPVFSADLLPTVLEVAGEKAVAKAEVDGLSLLPVLRNGSLPKRKIFWDYPHYGNQGGEPGGAVREGHWKYIEWRQHDLRELYDLAKDPGEERNVVAEHPEVAARLHDALAKWRVEVGAKQPTPNPRYRPKKK